MDKYFERALDLSRRTGGRMIFYDSSRPENTFVLMPINDYERFLSGNDEIKGLTEEELIDKINRDIAIWKSDQNSNVSGLNEPINHIKPKSEYDLNGLDELEDLGEIKEKNRTVINEPMSDNKNKKKNHWIIPKERKAAAEEIIEEDRQYLEDVNY